VARVVHGGDLAVAGCSGPEVVDLIRELGWPGIVGNTDELLWRPEEHDNQLQRAPELAALLSVLFDSYAPVTRAQLGDERLQWLRQLPPEHREPDPDLALVHASPGEPWRAPAPDADEQQLADTYGPLNAAIAVYGHIHRPFVRHLDQVTVINSGSVGNPFDGDARAGYALIDGDRAEIVRVEYDIEREVHTVLRSGYPDADRIAAMRQTGEFVPVTRP
jgi:diadenosine tetraphosphatase ApaH/serine/threonine PP2A family protein phosphatase